MHDNPRPTERSRIPDQDGTRVQFIDLQTQRARLAGRIEAAIARVLEHGRFVMGPEVSAFEDRLADLTGTRHCIACSSGTDALRLALMSLGVGCGDAVFVPAFTFAATAEAVALAGATPCFVDVDADTFTLNADHLLAAVREAERIGLSPRGIVPVDLFGHPADYNAIRSFASENSLFVLADAAQSLGASMDGAPVGTLADITATSFYPSKPLGCYGDGGGLLTNDDVIADRLRSLLAHGKGVHKYDHVRVGLNARLDTLQAAILLEKLTIFADEVSARQKLVAHYNKLLSGWVRTPGVRGRAASAWACYTIVHKNRDAIAAACDAANIETIIHYPRALADQAAYRSLPCVPDRLATARELAQTVLSLPLHPYLDEATQERIADVVIEAVSNAP